MDYKTNTVITWNRFQFLNLNSFLYILTTASSKISTLSAYFHVRLWITKKNINQVYFVGWPPFNGKFSYHLSPRNDKWKTSLLTKPSTKNGRSAVWFTIAFKFYSHLKTLEIVPIKKVNYLWTISLRIYFKWARKRNKLGAPGFWKIMAENIKALRFRIICFKDVFVFT